MFSANLEDLDVQEDPQNNIPEAPSAESQDQAAPSQSDAQGGAV
jgi:hypothetical protein